MHTCLMCKLAVVGVQWQLTRVKPSISKPLTETNEIFMLGRLRHHIFYHEQAITHIHTHIFICLYRKYTILIPASFVLDNDR